MSGKRHQVVLEWVLRNQEDLRVALPAMLKFRKMNLEKLSWVMSRNGVPRSLVGAFIRGSQKNLRFDSFVDTIEALDLEVVVRRKSQNKTKAQVEALRRERGLPPGEEVHRAAVLALVPEEARDPATGHLLRPLTEQERAQAHALLDEYGSFS